MTLSYSNFFSPTHVQSLLAEEWCREVEARTDGRVTIEYFPGGTLTKGNVCYDGVVNGLSDIGMSALGYTRGRFPVMEAADLPLGQTNGRIASAVINELYQELRPAEMDDVEVMYFHAHGPGLLHTRDTAVRTLADMQGLKIRCHGTSLKIVEALGAVPVAKLMNENYQLLQKGVVDGSVYPIEANKGWNLAEVIDYVTLSYPAAYTTGFFVVMNKDRWNEISPEDQAVIREINQEWIEKTGGSWDAADAEGYAYLEEMGVETIALSDEESAAWAAAVRPVLDEWAAAADAAGLPGSQALEISLNAVAKYKEIYQ